jgi:hypothetical protein
MLKNMRREDINIVAIDQHMTKEEPRILFFYYWVEGKAAGMAQSLKSILNAPAMPAYLRRTDEPSQQLSGAACTSMDVRFLCAMTIVLRCNKGTCVIMSWRDLLLIGGSQEESDGSRFRSRFSCIARVEGYYFF